MKLSALIFLAIAVQAHAVGDFSGIWVGEGEVSGVAGLGSKCSKVEIIVEQTETSVFTKKYESTCDLYGSTWGPIQQDYHDGQVFENGEPVGIIDDTHMTSTAPDGGAIYIYNLTLVPGPNGTFELDSEYGVQNFVGTLMTRARLKRVP